jgi:hypothetical protein
VLTYDARPINRPGELTSAIESARKSAAPVPKGPAATNEVPIEIQRNDKRETIHVAPGKLGVQLSRLALPEALNIRRELSRSPEQRLREVQKGGLLREFGRLPALPEARRSAPIEVQASRREREGWCILNGAVRRWLRWRSPLNRDFYTWRRMHLWAAGPRFSKATP